MIRFLILCLCPVLAFAETKFDKDLQAMNIIDGNYKIIDMPAFDELMRLSTEQVAPMLPAKIDSVTTALNMSLNRFGIYMIYQIDNIETKEQAKSIMETQGLAEGFKNYICSLEYSQSLVFRNNGYMAANMTLVNNQNKVLYHLKMPFRDCEVN